MPACFGWLAASERTFGWLLDVAHIKAPTDWLNSKPRYQPLLTAPLKSASSVAVAPRETAFKAFVAIQLPGRERSGPTCEAFLDVTLTQANANW